MKKGHNHYGSQGGYGGINPVRCIVPGHMLREIIQSGTANQREWAWRTMAISEQIRGQRQALARPSIRGLMAVGQKNRSVYDAQTGYNLPGVIVRTEGGPVTSDPAADEAYDGAGHTYDL